MELPDNTCEIIDRTFNVNKNMVGRLGNVFVIAVSC